MAEADPAKRVFGEYVSLRRSGYSRDRASALIGVEANALSTADQERLLELQRRWEAREAHASEPGAPDDPYQTLPKVPAPGKARSIRRIRPELPATMPLPETITCPDCGAMNDTHATHCVQCGLQLQPVEDLPEAVRRVRDETQRLVAESTEKTYFGPEMQLVLRVPDFNDVIRTRVRATELVIGRRSPESVVIPDIDLTPYQGSLKGVSRLHAAIRRQGNTLVLADLESLNHTYINGQRVYSQEVRVLRHGDELRFGQLRVLVSFEPG